MKQCVTAHHQVAGVRCKSGYGRLGVGECLRGLLKLDFPTPHLVLGRLVVVQRLTVGDV